MRVKSNEFQDDNFPNVSFSVDVSKQKHYSQILILSWRANLPPVEHASLRINTFE